VTNKYIVSTISTYKSEMADNTREYHSIKFFRGRKRNNSELQRLADEGLDFDYRRLLILENETDLHVAFSRIIIWKRLGLWFIILAIICLQLPIIALIFSGLAVLSLFFSYLNKRFFQFVMRSHNVALGFVNAVIFNKYGISF
jgi:hypothetical protein